MALRKNRLLSASACLAAWLGMPTRISPCLLSCLASLVGLRFFGGFSHQHTRTHARTYTYTQNAYTSYKKVENLGKKRGGGRPALVLGREEGGEGEREKSLVVSPPSPTNSLRPNLLLSPSSTQPQRQEDRSFEEESNTKSWV